MNDTASFSNAVQTFAGNYRAVTNWSEYDKSSAASFKKNIKGKYIIVPILKEQITNIKNTEFTDTSLVYFGKQNNAFVFILKKGERNFEKLSQDKNGLLLMKITDIDYSSKLYLEKKPTDFMHKERKLSEFVLKAELVDAVNIGTGSVILNNKFSLE